MAVTTIDARTATLRAFRDFLAGLTWEMAGKQRKFAKVYDTWPDFDEQFKVPAASTILVRAEIQSGPSTPFVVSQEIHGSVGTALVQAGEWVGTLQLDVWTETIAEMDSVMRALQDALNPDVERYGLVLEAKEYFGAQARFSYVEERPEVDEASAAGNQRRTTLTIEVECPYLREKKDIPVFQPRVTLEASEDVAPDPADTGTAVGG